MEFTREEIATILAALDYYVECGQGDPDERSDAIHDIATDGGNLTPLDAYGVIALCDKINGAKA